MIMQLIINYKTMIGNNNNKMLDHKWLTKYKETTLFVIQEHFRRLLLDR